MWTCGVVVTLAIFSTTISTATRIQRNDVKYAVRRICVPAGERKKRKIFRRREKTDDNSICLDWVTRKMFEICKQPLNFSVDKFLFLILFLSSDIETFGFSDETSLLFFLLLFDNEFLQVPNYCCFTLFKRQAS